ncbi:MAG TPA: hypothetical protein VI911_04990, partial [Patescibacteria group bacterium]|nr:hypothetical protein [Patescibacteria group bacterium]
DSITLDTDTTGTTSVTSSNSGLEVTGSGLKLLGGCSDAQSLVWDATAQVWKCATGGGTITGSGASGQLTFWNGSTSITGSNSLWWDSTNSRLGLGTTAPTSQLEIAGTGVTNGQFRIAYDSTNYTKFAVDSTGALTFNNNGTDIAKFAAANAEFYVPTTFSAAGDVSMAYDLIFTNQVSSQIESYGPISIIAGENHESNDLTLKTYNAGDVVADLSGTGRMKLYGADTTLLFDTRTTTDTDYWMGIIDDAAGDDDDVFAIGKGLTNGTTPYLAVKSDGNLGIGTTAPAEKLDVEGRIYISSTSAPSPTTNRLYNLGGSLYWNGTDLTASGAGISGSGVASQITFWSGTSAVTGSNNLWWDNVGGNLGLGTSAPTAWLDIAAATTAKPSARVASGVAPSSPVTGDIYNDGDQLYFYNGSTWQDLGATGAGASGVTGSGVAGQLTFWNGTSSIAGNNNLWWDNSNSRLGIGFTNPIGALDVAGTAWLRGANANQGLFVNTDGNVGIGTTNPASALQVAGNIFPSADDTYDLGSSAMRWQDVYIGPSSIHIGTNGNEAIMRYMTAQNFLGFDPDGDGVFEFTMNDGGNLGIGTTNPQFALDVAGSANVTNLFIAGSVVTTSATELNLLSGRTGTLLDSNNVGTYATTAVTAGSGLAGGGTIGALTLNIGGGNGITINADDITIDATTTGTTAVTSNNSGLEVTTGGLRLLGGCSDTQILKWNSTGSYWYCAADSTGTAGTATIAGSGLATQVAFFSGSTSISGSNNLWWDNTGGNLGIGISAPTAKLMIAGSADTEQFVIKANGTQSNTNPLIQLQDSTGTALLDITTDSVENVFIGRLAGSSNTVGAGSSGLYNTFVGSGAGDNNTAGYQNSTFGAYSLFGNTIGNNNTSMGVYSLFSNSTGSDNLSLGFRAGQYSTTGSYNVFLGT